MRLLFVIVLFNEKLIHTQTYNTLIKNWKTFPVFVFDNSGVPQHTPDEFAGTNIIYISDTRNPGLSYAYNVAAKYAEQNGIDWIMLLDQDTLFSPLIINEFKHTYECNPTIKLFVPPVCIDNKYYMSPVSIRNHITKVATAVPHGIVSSAKYTPINSGIIVNVEAFWKVGGYNEKVWLDHSDYQFIERFSRHYKEFYVLETVCKQEFSNIVQTPEQKLKRFSIFCECLRNCERRTFSDHFFYFYIVFKRMLSLTCRIHSITPFFIFLKKYL